MITGVTPDGNTQVSPLELSQYLAAPGSETGLVSLSGPFTAESRGFVPVQQDLPFAVHFQNDSASPTYTSEVRVVTKLDDKFDPRTFRLGDIRVGDIDVDVPADQSLFQEDRDFVRTRGFILRVSAGIDLESSTATWLLQAIDPLTGELIQDPTKGLLRPNNARGDGAGHVAYTVQVADDVETGERVRTTAHVLMNNLPPEDAAPLRFLVDAAAPTSTVTVTQSESAFNVDWSANDPNDGSGVKHVTLYVSTDGGPFKVWHRQVTESSGTRLYLGDPGHTYEFLSLATDNSGNRERPAIGRSVPDETASAAAPADNDTAPNFGQPIDARPDALPHPIFARVEQNVPNAPPAINRAEYSTIIQPFSGRAFATGIATSNAGIGPMAIVEAPDGTVLVSGGEARNLIYRLALDGGTVDEPLSRLDVPIFNMTFDDQGRLWATTGGGPLLQLDPTTGTVLNRYGDGITIALATHPVTGEIFVTTNRGIEAFDPDTASFKRFSRDLNLRYGSLAFANDGSLWAVTWPDRKTVVRFTDRAAR